MDIKFFSKGLNEKEEKKLQDYMQKKIPGFEKLLSHFAEDAVQMQITTQRFEKNNAFNVEIILKMPKKTIVGKEASHSIEKAVDWAKDRVVKQLKRHEEQLRSFSSEKVNNIETIMQPENRTHGSLQKTGNATDPLKKLIGRLEQFVQREMYHYKKKGKIFLEKGAMQSMVDEVVAEFYENFHAKMEESSIEEWLYSVAIAKIGGLVREYEKEKIKLSMDVEQDVHENRLSSYFQEEELENIEEIVLDHAENHDENPARKMIDKEAFYFAIEKLTDIPPIQRHAFMLYAIEKFTPERIAKIQKREKEEVENDIGEVRRVLSRQLQEEFE